MGAVLEGLRSLDAYPKPDEEQSVKTVTGAVGKLKFELFGLLYDFKSVLQFQLSAI